MLCKFHICISAKKKGIKNYLQKINNGHQISINHFRKKRDINVTLISNVSLLQVDTQNSFHNKNKLDQAFCQTSTLYTSILLWIKGLLTEKHDFGLDFRDKKIRRCIVPALYRDKNANFTSAI